MAACRRPQRSAARRAYRLRLSDQAPRRFRRGSGHERYPHCSGTGCRRPRPWTHHVVACERRIKAKPNIVFIMGDDIGWFNIGAYHRGMMAGRTPNLDRLAAEGHAVHRLLRRGELHRRPRELHHRPAADPHRPDDRRSGGRQDRHAGRGADHRHGAQGRWATPPASSARTTSATATSTCPRCTASTSSSATSTTSTRWRTRLIRTTRRS